MSYIFYPLYLLFVQLLALIVIPFFLIHKRGRRRFFERLGFIKTKESDFNQVTESNEITWFHIASVGELKGLEHIILDFIKNDKNFILSSISVSALEYFEKKHPNTKQCISNFLLPFDAPIFYRKIFKNYKIENFIFAESEFWPILFILLNKKKVNLIGVNVKVSSGGYKTQKLFKLLDKNFHSYFTYLCVVNKKSYDYLIDLGVLSNNVSLTGNMKYAELINNSNSEEVEINLNKPVLVLGSIRKKEEILILEALESIEIKVSFTIVLAPRQLEEIEYFIRALDEYNFLYTFNSKNKNSEFKENQHSFIILDSIGELEKFYKVADIAFIGGSLVEGFGGHNPLEAAKYKKPILMGQYYYNVEDLIEENESAFNIIESKEDLIEALLNFKSNKFINSANCAYNLYLKKQNIPNLVKEKLAKYLN